jgi:hypothetical protein
LEAGLLYQWLFGALAGAGLPVICNETRYMQAVLKAQINKTLRSQKLRMLTHRKLQSKAIAIENKLRATFAQLRSQGGHRRKGEVRGTYQEACREPA